MTAATPTVDKPSIEAFKVTQASLDETDQAVDDENLGEMEVDDTEGKR